MNFQVVEQNNGKLVDMFGTFIEIGGVQYTPSQKMKAICKIADDNGVSHNVHIHQGKGQLPTPAQLQQRHAFSISTFQGTSQRGSYTGYSGFWKDKIQVNQPQSAPPQVRQAPQRPAGPPKSGRDGERVSIERQAAGRSACFAWDTATPEDILKLAIALQYFHETGKNFYEIPEPDKSIQNEWDDYQPPTDADVPFP